MNDRPQRAHSLILSFGADTREELAACLADILRRLRAGRLSQGVFGGCGSGGAYSYKEDPAMHHDAYFEQLEAYLEATEPVVTEADE